MELPAFVEFTEDVLSLDIKAGDRVWVTSYSTTLVRSLPFTVVKPHLHLTKPIELRIGKTSEVAS